MKRIIGIVLKYVQILKRKLSPPSDVLTATHSGVLDIELLEKASSKIIKMLQQREFIKKLRIRKKAHKQNPSNNDQSTVTYASPIYSFDPFLDDNDVLRLGDRLRNSSLNRNLMHPILLPRRSVITSRIIDWCHNRSGRSGRNMTLNEIRCNGFWIINGNSAVRSHIYHCVTCRKANLESRRWQISLKKDKVMQHLSHMLAWICLGPLLLKEVERSYSAILLSLHASLVGPYTLKL